MGTSAGLSNQRPAGSPAGVRDVATDDELEER